MTLNRIVKKKQEELDEHRIQTSPSGFHVIYLPFADDFRQIDRKLHAKASANNIALFSKCINKLKFKYNPEDFKNPSIQKIWSEIEAIALDRSEPEPVIDLTLPNVERIEKRAGQYLKEFAEVFGLDSFANSFATSKSKRKVLNETSENNEAGKKVKKETGEIDMEYEAKSGKVKQQNIHFSLFI